MKKSSEILFFFPDKIHIDFAFFFLYLVNYKNR